MGAQFLFPLTYIIGGVSSMVCLRAAGHRHGLRGSFLASLTFFVQYLPPHPTTRRLSRRPVVWRAVVARRLRVTCRAAPQLLRAVIHRRAGAIKHLLWARLIGLTKSVRLRYDPVSTDSVLRADVR